MGVNILVAHGGGPTAVINTSLQGVVEAARESGKVDKIYAARFGAEGILKGDLLDLTDVPASTIRQARPYPRFRHRLLPPEAHRRGLPHRD